MKGADGQLQPVQVTTGDTNGNVTEVLSGGLKPGMEVVTGQLSGTEGRAAAKGAGQRSGQRAGGAGGA